MLISKTSLKKAPIKLLKRAGLAMGIGTGIVTGLYTDSVNTGGLERAPNNRIAVSRYPTLQQLYQEPDQEPASRESLITLVTLTFADTQADLNILRDAGKIRYSAAASLTHGPSPEFKYRAPLYDVSVEDPAKSGQYLDFQMICHHHDPNGLNAFAFYNKANKAVFFIFPGLDIGDKTQWNDLFATLHDEHNPQIDSVNSFMKDVEHQIIARPLRVEHATIFSHSLGGGPAVAAKACWLRDRKLQHLLGGKISTVILDDWGASKTAHYLVKQYRSDITLRQLTKDCTSVRNVPGNFTSVSDNPPIGYKVAIMPVQANYSPWGQLFYREWNHRAICVISGLSNGRTVVVNEETGEAPRFGLVELAMREQTHGRLGWELVGVGAMLGVGGALALKKRAHLKQNPKSPQL